MVEENLGPLAELISSLVEIRSLVKASCPLNKFLVFGSVSDLVLVRSEISIIELLFP